MISKSVVIIIFGVFIDQLIDYPINLGLPALVVGFKKIKERSKK